MEFHEVVFKCSTADKNVVSIPTCDLVPSCHDRILFVSTFLKFIFF